jgi:putative inorganic carbon (hco3(-)) transporter
MPFYYLFLLLAPFQEHPTLGIVLLEAGPIPITPTKLVGILMVIAAFLAPRPLRAAPRLSSAIPTLYMLFVLLPLVEVFGFGLPTPTRSLSALISYGLLIIATRRLVCTPDRLNNVLRVLVLAETIGSLWLYKQQYIEHIPNPHGPSSDSNYEALSLVMMLPLAVYLLSHDVKQIWRTISLICLPVLAFAVFVSQSRGGVVALGTLCLLGWIRSRRKLAMAVGGLVILAALALAVPDVTWSRFQQIQVTGRPQTGAEMSTRTRVELWRGGLRMIEAHPLFGIGLDQFRAQIGYYNPALYEVSNRTYIAHNTYIHIAAEEGLPILCLFMAMLRLASRNFRLAQRSGPSNELSDVASSMKLGLIAYLIAAFFLSAQLEKTLWVFIALSQNLREIAANKAGINHNEVEGSTIEAA